MQLKCVFQPGTYAYGAVYSFNVWQKPTPTSAEALALQLPPFTAPTAPRWGRLGVASKMKYVQLGMQRYRWSSGACKPQCGS